MSEIIHLTSCLAVCVTKTQLRQLRQVILAMLSMTGRVTMVGLARWTGKGGSYRTIQRWFTSKVDWGGLLWAVVDAHLTGTGRSYLLAVDEGVVSKAGQLTHGVGRFYSSMAGRPMGGLSFVAASLVDVAQRRAYPVQVEPRVPTPKTTKPGSERVKRGRGRPPGSKNHAKAAPVLSGELMVLDGLLGHLLRRISVLQVKYLVMDGFFGNYPTTWLAAQHGLSLISKLRHNAVLFFPYTDAKPRRGPTPRYGDRLDYAALPTEARPSVVVEGRFVTETFALTLLHKDFPNPLNVLVVARTDTRSHKRSPVVLFSTDRALLPAQLADYYALRFQIEFNFRDAKQYFGLEDFMNVVPLAVTNVVGLAFLMVNLSAVLLAAHRLHSPDFSVLDLKALFRARRYLHETIITLPEPPPPPIIYHNC